MINPIMREQMTPDVFTKLCSILDSQDEGSLIFDVNTNEIVLANKQACRSLGFTINEMISSHLDIIIPKNFNPITFKRTKDIISKELRQIVTKCGYSFMAGIKKKKIAIKNKKYHLISFQNLSQFAEISGSYKNTDKEYIKFVKRLLLINQKTTNVNDDMFYKNMVYSLAEEFKVQWVMICLLSSVEKKAKILSLWDQTKFHSEIVYTIEGTPCGKINEIKNHVYCEKNLTKHYPEDILAYQWGVESYLGVPITTKTGEILGFLAVMDNKPIKKNESIEYLATMQYFSDDIAKEIVLNNFKITTLKKETPNKLLELTSKQKSLTNRELQVLDHVFSGLSSDSISKQLTVSLPTVKFHLKNIYKKLGVNGRKGLLKVISKMP
jgi:DNA-binding CsgD family transcriptional regulator